MKLTNKELAQIIRESLLKEERYDCIKDYMAMGYSKSEAYKECPPDEDDDDNWNQERQSSRKTSYTGATADESDQEYAIMTAVNIRPNKFLQSILSQLRAGRVLSTKQKNI